MQQKSLFFNLSGWFLIPMISSAFITTLAFAQHPNIRISSPAAIDPEEVTIAINPVNPKILAGGANINYSYSSTDGGSTWGSLRLVSPSFGVWGDPSVIFDEDGNLYYAHLSNPPSGGYWIDRIVVQKSTDNGLTWDDGYGIGYDPPLKNQDKEWLATDCTRSPYHGNVYLAWTEFDRYGSANPADSSRILFSRTTDHGLTWSSPVRVSDEAGNCIDSDSTDEGAVPAIGPDGQVYVSWSGPRGILFDKSTDGGLTWGADRFVTSQPGGWDFNVPGIYRCNGMPVTACDASHSPYRGTIYINWSDQRNGGANTDVFLIKSTDQGTTWGPVIRVNDDTGSHQQFFTWMTVDQSDGTVYVVFYDRRNTTGNATDVFCARSTDGGETFSNFIVSDSPFVPQAGIFFGDYTNIAALNGTVYPVWMRLDSSNSVLSVWTAIVRKSVSVSSSVLQGWNMLSVPVRVSDSAGTSLFPVSDSRIFSYEGRYVPTAVVHTGKGYWVRFPAAGSVSITGDSLLVDSIPVNDRWNMIGSLTTPVPVSSIGSIPPGLVVSGFFMYTGTQYVPVDTLLPGRGYWVKADHPGSLVLSGAGQMPPSKLIAVLPDGELPPPPPENIANAGLPAGIALDQNFPNPFNPSTVIRYHTDSPGFVTLTVYDILGREIRHLAEGFTPAGYHTSTFAADRVPGSPIPGGVYYYRLTMGSLSETKQMIYIK